LTTELAEANLLNHKTEVVGGVLQEECSALLSGFFISIRQKQKEEKERKKLLEAEALKIVDEEN
jgi:tRNA(adenine34) deaminase